MDKKEIICALIIYFEENIDDNFLDDTAKCAAVLDNF